jgi:DNA-binding NtrC family response regulator
MVKLFIVDDEEDICESIAEMLQDQEVEVRYVVTGEEALKRVAEEKFDIYIIDMKLSTVVSGLQITKAVRNAYPNVVIVAMSGYIDADLKKEAERIGVTDFLEKPSDLAESVFAAKLKVWKRKLV